MTTKNNCFSISLEIFSIAFTYYSYPPTSHYTHETGQLGIHTDVSFWILITKKPFTTTCEQLLNPVGFKPINI